MAKIQTILSTGGYNGGSTGPQANPSSFGSDVSGLQRGVGYIGQAADKISDNKFSIEMKLAQLDEMRQTNEAESYLRKISTQFLQDPANQADESSQDRYQQMMDKESKKLVSQAKGKETALKIENLAGDITSGGYNHLVANSAALKASRASVSIIQNNQVNLLAGGPDHETHIARSFEQIDSAFGNKPSVAAALKEQVVRDSVLSFAPTNPARAQNILDTAKEVDGPTRHQLQHTIDTANAMNSGLAIENLDNHVKDVIDGLKFGNDVPPPDSGPGKDPLLTEKNFVKVYGKQHGPVKYQQMEQDWNAYAAALDYWQSISSLPPHEQADKVTNLVEAEAGSKFKDYVNNASPDGNQNRAKIANILKQKAGESAQYLNSQGPVAWLKRYNPGVASLEAMKRNAGSEWTPEEQSQYNKALIELQTGDKAGSLKHTNPSLLDRAEATGWVARINEAKNPDEVLQIVDGLTRQFPSPDQLSIGLRDLDNVPGTKIAGNWRFLIQNRDQDWVRGYADAITNYKNNLGAIPKDETFNKFDAQLATGTKIWNDAFGRLRASDAQDLREATRVYATHLMVGKNAMKQNDAIAFAVDKLAGSTLKPAMVNGSSFAVHKNAPDTTDSILSRVLSNIDPEQIDGHNFDGVMATITPEDRINQLHKAVSTQARFEMSSDGQTLHLVMEDAGGALFSIRDKKGKPFAIAFEDLDKIDASMHANYKRMGVFPIMPGVTGASIADYTLTSPKSNFHVRP